MVVFVGCSSSSMVDEKYLKAASDLAEFLCEHDCTLLFGSSENGIDTVREKVVSYASSVSLEFGSEKMKVIYIDEADGFTPQAWDALRETIERYASNVRFVCTCNNY